MTAIEHPLSPDELMEYLDGELTVEQAAAVQAHVATCIGCQRLSVELRAVSRDLARWQVEGPPATFEAPLVPAGSTDGSRSRFGWLRFRPSSAYVYAIPAVAIVAVVAIVSNFSSKYSQASISTSPVLARDGKQAGAPLAVPEAMEALPVFPSERALDSSAPSVPRSPEMVPGGSRGRSTVARQSSAPAPRAPAIARTARLRIRATDFEAARPIVDRVVASTGGLVGRVNVSGSRGDVRTLTATLHIPAAQLDAALSTLKSIGRVVDEAQSGEDVTEQVVDVTARLANARNTEKRLTDLLQKRTGDLADVLAAEREIARVREEIERLDAQRQALGRRVIYATLNLEILEEPRATLNLGPRPVPGRFRDALVTGVTDATDTALGLALLVIRILPSLLLWGAVLYWPVRAARRWAHRPALHREP
jgi:anti-sigma factor RsiW